VFIVVDALDECGELNNERECLLLELQKLTSAHLFITSRPNITNIREYFSDLSKLEILAPDQDVELFVDGQIARRNRLKRFVQEDAALRDDIVNGIIKNARGM
jgi:hypothetical protein